MVGQDPKGDQSPERASGRTCWLEQRPPGIKAPLFLHGWVVGGFLGGWDGLWWGGVGMIGGGVVLGCGVGGVGGWWWWGGWVIG